MYGKIAVALAIVALLLGTTSAVAATGVNTSQSTMGNFSFGYNSAASVITNLSFQGKENSYLVANDVYVNGTSVVNGTTTPTGSISLKNGSIVNTGKENLFLVADSAGLPSVTFVLLSHPSRVSVPVNMTLAMGMNVNSLTFYQVAVGNRSAMIFSNGNATVSGDSLVFSHPSQNPILFAGVSNWESVSEYLQNQLQSRAKFHYNSTTDHVTGSFVSFGVNSSTGSISNFYSQLTSNTVFSSITVSGNTNFTFGSGMPVFPLNSPIVIGSLFVYATNTSVYAIHDTPSIASRFVFNNGSAVFTLGSGMNATVYNTSGQTGVDQGISGQVMGNESAAAQEVVGTNYAMEGGHSIVYVHGREFRGFLVVRNANASVSGNQIIVTGSHVGMVGLVAPEGLQGTSQRAIADLEYAILTHRVGAELMITNTNGTINELSVEYNGSMSLSVTNMGAGKVAMTVSSLQHVGNVIAVFISNSVFSNTSKVSVTFDNTAVSVTDLNGTLNSTSTTAATYVLLHIRGGLLLLIHVPHYSTHTIDIAYSSAGSSSLPVSGGVIVLAGIGVVVIIAAAVMLTRRKKP